LIVFDTSHTHCYRSPSYCPCVPGQGGGGTTRSCFPQRLVCLALSGCSGFAWGGRLTCCWELVRAQRQVYGARGVVVVGESVGGVGSCPTLGQVRECSGCWSRCE
jgi:hypothetical protein